MPPTLTDHSRSVLAAIVPSRADLLNKSLIHLSPEHFVDPTLRNMYVMLTRYADATGGIVTRGALMDLLRRADAGAQLLYGELYDALAAQTVRDDEFLWSLGMIRELTADQQTRDAITNGLEISLRGWKDPRSKEDLSGHLDARRYLTQMFAEIDRDLSMQESPEGDIRTERNEMLADYAERKKVFLSGRGRGVMFGIPGIDSRTGGLQNGELWTVAGYSGEGKTTLCCGQLAWSAAVEQGLDVVIFTTETIREQVRRKLTCRHSRLPMFEMAQGINSNDLKNGTLDPEQESKLQMVVDDLTRNPMYGKLHIAQVPRNATISTIEARLRRIVDWRPKLVVVDYFALFRPEYKRQTVREELGDIFKEAKTVAVGYDDGSGVPIVSPWQVNRSARDEAARNHHYTTKALSETSESVNSSDGIISLLVEDGQLNRRAIDMKAQILKNRDGETAPDINLIADYATSWIQEKAEAAAVNYLSSELGNDEDLLSVS